MLNDIHHDDVAEHRNKNWQKKCPAGNTFSYFKQYLWYIHHSCHKGQPGSFTQYDSGNWTEQNYTKHYVKVFDLVGLGKIYMIYCGCWVPHALPRDLLQKRCYPLLKLHVPHMSPRMSLQMPWLPSSRSADDGQWGGPSIPSKRRWEIRWECKEI